MPAPIVAIPRRMNFGRPQTTRLGPWPRGIDYAFADLDSNGLGVKYASNVDILPTGELKQRPPITTLNAGSLIYGNNSTILAGMASGTRWEIDCVYPYPVAATNSVAQVIVGRNITEGWLSFIETDIVPVTAPLAVLQGFTSNLVYYNAKLWGIWLTTGANYGKVFSIPANSPGTAPTYYGVIPTSVTSPNGTVLYPKRVMIYKDRMYAWDYGLESSANVNTISYSTTGDPSTFTGTDAGFFQLSPSGTDGTNVTITAVIGVRNTLYIFTENSVWSLSLPSSGIPPNGVLQQVSARNGAFNANCVGSVNGRVFFVGITGVYEIFNSIITDISTNLERLWESVIAGVTKDATSITVTDDSVIVCATTNIEDNYPADNQHIFAYTFNLNSRAWSVYSFIPTVSNSHGTFTFRASKLVPYTAFNTNAVAPQGNTTDPIPAGYFFLSIITGEIFIFNKYITTSGASAWTDNTPSGLQSIVMQVRLNDWSGGSTEDASIKRIYAVTHNLHLSKNLPLAPNFPQITTKFTDNNGNTITDTTVSLPWVLGQQYYSIKQYASLRVRRIEFFLSLNTGGTGPWTILSLDVLAKIKVGMADAMVSG